MLRKSEQARIMASMDDLGQVLEQWRENAGLSKTDAAKRCGITPQHWWLLAHNERPNLSGETIEKLANGTGYAPEVLLQASQRTRAKLAAEGSPVPA